MKKLIKIFLNLSYIVSLATLVFFAGIFNRFTNAGHQEKEGKTIIGGLLSPDIASADIPSPPDGPPSNSGDCGAGDGGGGGDCC